MDFISTTVLWGWNAEKQVLGTFSDFLEGFWVAASVCLKLWQFTSLLGVDKYFFTQNPSWRALSLGNEDQDNFQQAGARFCGSACQFLTGGTLLDVSVWVTFNLVGARSDLWRSSSSSPPLEQSHLEEITQGHMQTGFECLRRRRLRKLSGQAGPVLCHLQSENFFPLCLYLSYCLKFCILVIVVASFYVPTEK